MAISSLMVERFHHAAVMLMRGHKSPAGGIDSMFKYAVEAVGPEMAAAMAVMLAAAESARNGVDIDGKAVIDVVERTAGMSKQLHVGLSLRHRVLQDNHPVILGIEKACADHGAILFSAADVRRDHIIVTDSIDHAKEIMGEDDDSDRPVVCAPWVVYLDSQDGTDVDLGIYRIAAYTVADGLGRILKQYNDDRRAFAPA